MYLSSRPSRHSLMNITIFDIKDQNSTRSFFKWNFFLNSSYRLSLWCHHWWRVFGGPYSWINEWTNSKLRSSYTERYKPIVPLANASCNDFSNLMCDNINIENSWSSWQVEVAFYHIKYSTNDLDYILECLYYRHICFIIFVPLVFHNTQYSLGICLRYIWRKFLPMT